ncbi:MAG: hypothetical protein WA728_11040 [Xanthobacteraceae bacterium]
MGITWTTLEAAIMSIIWTVTGAAVVSFLLALAIQSRVQKRVMAANVRRYWSAGPKNTNKLARQDVSGIIFAITITNALLTAILATLILRS